MATKPLQKVYDIQVSFPCGNGGIFVPGVAPEKREFVEDAVGALVRAHLSVCSDCRVPPAE